MPLYQSNDLETLFSRLKEEIFKKKRNLFNLPTIAVASYGMKRWLKMKFAKEGVALGLRMETLEQALGKASSKYDLFIALFHLLQNLEREPEFEIVSSYVQNTKRAVHLAKLLSRNFYLYGIYGVEMEGWQKKLYKKLQEPPYAIQFWREAIQPLSKELHLFGFSYIPPLFFNTLEKGATIYCLSPCQEFWSQEAMPLLMSFGTMGREMAKQLDGKQTVPDYKVSLEDFSLLQALKLDLLFNKDQTAPTIEDFPEEDHSIELHEATSARREVEWVYQKLVELSNDPSFDPSKVLVVAKDIAPYVPYIKALFESEESLFDPLLFDQPKGELNNAYKYLEALVAFGKGRLEKHLYLNLIRNDAHYEKIEEWIEQASILWGFDIEHRNRCLKESGCKEKYGETEGIGTWKWGFEKLLDNLLLEEEPKIREAPLLGEWIKEFEALVEDLKIMEKERGPKEWTLSLEGFISKWVKGEEEELIELKLALKQIIPNLEFEPVLPFEVVWARIQDAMNQKENVLGDRRLHAIAFSSLFPNRAIPKDTIFFLGAQNKEFPRHEEENSLNQLVGKTFFPTIKYEDRYAFLEGILSSKKHLFISYQKEKGISSVVTELFDYLDKNFTLGGKKPSIARFYSHPKEEEETLIAGEPFLQPLKPYASSMEIDIKELESFAKDPLKAFYQKGVALRLKDGEVEIDETVESYELNTLERWSMASLLKAGKREGAYKKGQLPILSFKKLAVQEISDAEAKLKAYGLGRVLFFQKGALEKVEVSEELTLYPAIQIGGVTLEGALGGVTKKGLLVDSKADFASQVKVWPKLLILGLLGYPTTLLHWKLGNEKEIVIDNPKERLQEYIDFYLKCLSRPCPAHPDVVRAMLEKGYEATTDLMGKIEGEYWTFDRYKLTPEEFSYWQEVLRRVYV